MEGFAKIIDKFQPLIIVLGLSILDMCGKPDYASKSYVNVKNFVVNVT